MEKEKLRTATAFMRDTWRLAKPYWFSEVRWYGRGLLAVIVAMSLGPLESVVPLVAFVSILWGLSGALSFTLGGIGNTIPGYMVWVARV